MNSIIERLKGGDIRSDGEADEVAVDVLNHPILFAQLYAGLAEPDDVVRGRTAHALEHVSRSKPELLLPYLNKLVDQSTQDPLPVARWHLAMLFTNLSVYEEIIDTLAISLFCLLDDDSVFVKSWAISGLTIIGKHYPHLQGKVVEGVKLLRIDGSKAIQTRVRKALDVLENNVDIPAGWVKSELLKNLKTEFTGD